MDKYTGFGAYKIAGGDNGAILMLWAANIALSIIIVELFTRGGIPFDYVMGYGFLAFSLAAAGLALFNGETAACTLAMELAMTFASRLLYKMGLPVWAWLNVISGGIISPTICFIKDLPPNDACRKNHFSDIFC